MKSISRPISSFGLMTIPVLIFLSVWAIVSLLFISIGAVTLTILHAPKRLMGPRSFWHKHKFYNRNSL
jgi:hypothetical protein